MEPLRRRIPTQTHPHHHHYYKSRKDTRITKHESILSQSIGITTSAPFSIVRYCARIAARSGLKAVFSPSAKHANRVEQTTEGPIHSVWYGHANMTPDETLPSSQVHENTPIHHTGIEQWVEKAVVVNITPLVPCDFQGRDVDSRRRRLAEVPVIIVQRDEDLDWREPGDEEEASEETHPYASNPI